MWSNYTQPDHRVNLISLKLTGNDAVQLSMDTKGGRRVVDTYGDIKEDGFKSPWDYENGFGYRKDETGM